MSFDGNGNFSIINTFVFDTVISETEVNTNFSDIATGLSNCITADGQQTITANIPMDNFKFTGLGAGNAATDSANLGQVQAGDFKYDSVGGTANALTLSPTPAITSYAAGQEFIGVISGTPSSTAVTLAVSGLPTKAVEIDNAALSASVVLEANKHYSFLYDGTAFQATRISPSVSGDVVGPGSATDSAVALFDGTTGKLLKDGVVLGTSSGNIPQVGTKSSSETLAGLVEKSTSSENTAGTDDTVFPSVAGVKEMIDTHADVKVVARYYAEYVTYSSHTSTIPQDGSIPQNTEGEEILTLSTSDLQSSSNRLRVRATLPMITGSTDAILIACLFKDSDADAIQLSSARVVATAVPQNSFVLEKEIAPGSTSAVTFKIRVGPTGGTLYVNGSTSNLFGNSSFVTIVIEEIEP